MTPSSRPFFALVREDPNVELSLTYRAEAKRIVVIGSGGCTALSLLSDEVEDLFVIDASAAQTSLVALRVAAIAALDRGSYLRWAAAPWNGSPSETWERVRAHLSPDVRGYWDARPDLLVHGVDGCGVTEAFYRFVGRSLRSADWPDSLWRALLGARSLRHQRTLVAQHFMDARFRVALQMLLSRATHELFYPQALFAHAAGDDFADRFARRFLDFASRAPLRGNYFLSQLIFGEYLPEEPGGLPPYLDEARYPIAKRNLHKLHLVTGSLQDSLDGSIRADAFFLSNVLDWADLASADRLGHCVRAAAAPHACVLLRHMLGRTGLPATLKAERDPVAEAQALRIERSFLYGAISIGWIAGTDAKERR